MRTTTARARGTGGWHGAVLTCTLPTSKHAALAATTLATALGAATESTALAAVFVVAALAATSDASSLRAARGAYAWAAFAWAWGADSYRVCTFVATGQEPARRHRRRVLQRGQHATPPLQ